MRGNPIHFDVAGITELGTGDVEAWRRLQRGDLALAHPFLTPEYARAVARAKPLARVALARDADERVVGVLAYEPGRMGIGRPIGDWLTDRQAMLGEPGLRIDADELLRACRLSAWRFDRLLASAGPLRPRTARRIGSLVADRRASGPDMLGRLSRHAAQAAARRAQRLAEHAGVLRFEPASRDPVLLAQLIAWKSEEHRRTWRPDLFAQPETRQVLGTLLENEDEACNGAIAVLRAGDRPVALHYVLRSPHVIASWIPASDPAYATWSPGWVLLLRMLAHAGRSGVERFDFGRRGERSAQQVATGSVPLLEGAIRRASIAGAASGAHAHVVRPATV